MHQYHIHRDIYMYDTKTEWRQVTIHVHHGLMSFDTEIAPE